jgi:putative membrane protein
MAGAAGGLVIALGAGPLNTLHAQETTVTKSADQQFVSRLATENMLEVRLGQIAVANALSPAVKQFATQMVSDHTAMQKQWMTVAERNDLEFKVEWTDQQKEEARRLTFLKGADFDRAYMGSMVQNHSARVSAFENERRVAHSADVRDLITRDLPALQSHLRLAQQVGLQVGADVPGGVATTPTAPPRTDTTIVTQNPRRADTTVVAQTPPRADTTIVTTQDPRREQPGDDRRTDAGRVAQGNVKADAEFIRNVGFHHNLQVRLGNLAQKRGRDAAVKRFGERMEKDHGDFQEQWKEMASRNGLKAQSGLGPENQADLTRLEKVSDKAFDRAYITLMIQTHNAYLNYWRKEGRGASAAPLRQLVSRGLPTLEEHMAMAKQIGRRIGVDADAALAGRRVASERSGPGTVIE